MRTTPRRWTASLRTCLGLSAVVIAAAPFVRVYAAEPQGPKNATVLLIRHAEKLDAGEGLSPTGEERARAYVKFFQELTIQSQSAKPMALLATADSKNSHRPRLTLEPLGKALNLTVEAPFKSKDYPSMTASLRLGSYDGKTTLVCWHRGSMPEILSALGADPLKLLPDGKWPENEYDWLLVLRYDAQGHLASAERVEEHLTAAAAR